MYTSSMIKGPLTSRVCIPLCFFSITHHQVLSYLPTLVFSLFLLAAHEPQSVLLT